LLGSAWNTDEENSFTRVGLMNSRSTVLAVAMGSCFTETDAFPAFTECTVTTKSLSLISEDTISRTDVSLLVAFHWSPGLLSPRCVNTSGNVLPDTYGP